MATKKKATKNAVMVRCYSGVFFGYLKARRGSEVDIRARHVWSWTSAGLARKALTVDDLALLGAGTGSKLSAFAEQTLLDVKQIVKCSAEAVRCFEALPCQ
jgi:hypothetical protein